MPMTPYANLSGDSGVLAWRGGADRIEVRFANGAVYVYTYASAGRDKVERMKALARAGRGLATFISQHAHDAWASKRP